MRNGGFTLAEVLMVLAIIGALLGLTITVTPLDFSILQSRPYGDIMEEATRYAHITAKQRKQFTYFDYEVENKRFRVRDFHGSLLKEFPVKDNNDLVIKIFPVLPDEEVSGEFQHEIYEHEIEKITVHPLGMSFDCRIQVSSDHEESLLAMDPFSGSLIVIDDESI